MKVGKAMNIRNANINDTKKCDELLTKLIQDERQYNENINPNFVVNGWYETKVNKDNVCLLVLEDDDNIVGFIYGFLEDLTLNIEPEAILDALYIDDNYRKKGYGEKLINSFLTWCKNKNVKFITVGVLNKNYAASTLYKKIGFNSVSSKLKLEL